jgi:hypothetical protein
MNVAKFETGEGFRPIGERRNRSSDTDFVRSTFSHKGRREGKTAAARTTHGGCASAIHRLAIGSEKRSCYGHDG